MAIRIPKLDRTLGDIAYTDSLPKTRRNYYDLVNSIPEGVRISNTAEEFAIKGSQTQETFFEYLFGKNPTEWADWQITNTGLRVPEDWYGKSDVSGKHIVYPRIVLIGGEEAGEVYIPKGQGRDVLEWHEDFGIPSVTGGISYPHSPYASHFWFNPNPPLDELSGHYDVAVVILRNWHTRPDDRCVDIDAACDRWSLNARLNDKIRFRPVRQLEESMKEAA